MKACTATFIGHRTCPELDLGLLHKTIETLIQFGIRKFLCGGLGEFDNLCAQTVRDLRAKYPQIRSHLIAYDRSQKVPDYTLFDTITFPTFLAPLYKTTSIVPRNRFLVDHAAVAVCYVVRNQGGAAKTFRYAQEHPIRLINLASPDSTFPII